MPRFRSANWEEYVAGVDNGDVSPPVEYEVTGTIFKFPEVGEQISIARDTRNGVKCDGIFTSSRISSIKQSGEVTFLETQNSVYQMEKI